MSVNNLFGTKWLVNEDIVFPPISGGYLLIVDVNIHVESAGDFQHLIFNIEGGNQIEVSDNDHVLIEMLYHDATGEYWLSDEYRFWSFVDGSPSDPGYSDPVLISWLEANATQIIDPPATEPFLNKSGLSKVWQNIQTYLAKKQEKLVSGTNIKTVNGQSLIGSGDIPISGAFALDTSAPCSYNELQEAINAPNAVLVKHEGGVYPFVEKWETDENNKRYVNIASLQRQGADKGAIYFFLEATIDDLDSPMVYSSNFVQPTGKPYTDSITGNLSNLATTEKTNLVGAVNEVNGKVGFHVAVGQERWVGTYTDENNVTYQVYSKQIYIPALPNTAGITKYEHGISNIKQILDIYGSTTDGFVLNAPRQTASDNIAIYQASKSDSNKTFSIEVGKDRSSKSAYVTVVYAKNN